MGRPKATGTCECGADIYSKGMCRSHYMKARAKGRPDRGQGEKRGHPLYMIWWERKERGSLCESWAADFLAFVAGVGDRPTPTHLLRRLRFSEPYGPQNFEWLDALRRQPGESKQAFNARKWKSRRERFPSYESQRSLKRKYNLTPEQWQAMHDAQGGKCGICGQEETRINPKTHAPQALSVDHCHDFGHVRELLCWRCNTTIGKAEHSVQLLTAMIEYLKRHEPEVI